MATIIDSLIVKLGLDSKEFDSGQKKVSQGLKNTSKDAEGAAKSISKFLAAIGGVYAIKRFVEGVIETSAALDRMSKNLNMSVQDLSAWSRAAEIAGGTGNGLQGTFQMLSKAQTELRLTGESGLIPYFSALGISMAQAGQARPVADMLLDMADRFSKMDRATAFNMGQMMGVDEGTMTLLLRGRNEVELMIKKQKEQGAVTKKQAEEASRMREGIVKIKQDFESFGRELLSKVTPALERLLDKFQRFSAWIGENQEFVIKFLKILAGSLIAVGLAATPVNLAVTAVLALAAGIALLKQDYDTWKRGGESLIDWGKWEPGLRLAGNAIRWLKDLLDDVLYRAIAAADVLCAVFSRDWRRVKYAAGEFWRGNGKKYGADEAPAPPGGGRSRGTGGAPSGTVNSTGKKTAKFSPGGNTDRNTFVTEAAKLLGVSPDIIDAHIRLETGASGESTIGAFNYGNIKGGSGWGGATETRDVIEYNADGTPRTDRAKFRSYSDPKAAAQDYAKLIGSRYKGAVGAKTPQDYAAALKAGGYATDPNYVAKFGNIARGIPGAGAGVPGPGARPGTVNNNRQVETHIGEVKVYSAATDADGIARDMGKSLDYLFTSQANYGLN